ncbi:MAG: AAA family ATPase [Acidobacteriota bacterium]
MIRIRRGAAPEVLRSARLEMLRESWGVFAEGHESIAYRAGELFAGVFDVLDLGPALLAEGKGVCAYCGAPVDAESLEVGHIRPRANTVNFSGEHFPRHYFWLAFEWSNLVPMCRPCSVARGNRFPLVSEADRIPVPASPDFDADAMEVAVAAEPALLVDPTREDPEEHFTYDLPTGEVAPLTERGDVTIELFDLNRPELVEARRLAVLEIEGGDPALDPASLEGVPYAGIRRQALRARRDAVGAAPGAADPDEKGTRGTLRSLPDEAGSTGEMAGEPAPRVLRDGAPPGIDPWEKRSVELASAAPPLVPEEKPSVELSAPPPPLVPEEKPSVELSAPPPPLVPEEKPSVELSGSAPPLPSGGPSVGDAGYYRRSRKIEKVVLRDFRSIESLTLNMAAGDADRAGWTVLLGENGTGKSTVLHGIALALAGHAYREQLQEERSLDASAFVRRSAASPTPRSGSVEVYLSGVKEPVGLKVVAGELQFSGEAEAPVLLLGYGSTRLLPRGGASASTGSEHARVDNLFDPFVALGDARQFLLGLEPSDFGSVAAAFAALLDLGSDVRLVQNRDEDRIDVHLFETIVPLEQLSDGYQSVIALAADIMSILRQRWGSMAVAEGIVLLDELGAHLHPKWRLGIVQSLRQTFPRVQFIVTTHDPLCLRGLRAGEVIVMRRDLDRRVVAWADLPPTEGLRVDQLLTSEHFGLQSTLGADVERDFEQYYALLARDDLDDKEETRLTALEKRFGQRRLLGETRRERLMLSAIDRFLAKEASLSSDGERRAAENALELELEATLEALEI